MTWVGLGGTRVVKDGFPRIFCTSAGAVTGSGTQAVAVTVVGGYEQAAIGGGFLAVVCGLVETLAATPPGPRHVVVGGEDGDGGARPQNQFAKETRENRCTTEMPTGLRFLFNADRVDLKIFFFNVYLFLTQRQSTSGGGGLGGEGEGGR